MARDMDFSGSRGGRRPQKPTNPQPLSVSSSPSANKPTAANKSVLRNWLGLIIIAAVGILAFWFYFQPISTSQKTVPPVTLTTSPTLDSTGSSTNSLVATKNSLPTVQIYDSGAGPDVVSKVISSLKALGYPTENQAKSQFNYNKTYIWYVTGLEADATKIQSTLTGRVVEVKESKSAGSFEIMILLGSK